MVNLIQIDNQLRISVNPGRRLKRMMVAIEGYRANISVEKMRSYITYRPLGCDSHMVPLFGSQGGKKLNQLLIQGPEQRKGLDHAYSETTTANFFPSGLMASLVTSFRIEAPALTKTSVQPASPGFI